MPPFVLLENPFLAADFFAPDFLVEDFFAATLFAADFLELDFFAGIVSRPPRLIVGRTLPRQTSEVFSSDSEMHYL
jgi:hypothetical protein